MIIEFLLLSIAINLVFFLFAYFLQTDKVTDFTYSLTFIILSFIGYVDSDKTWVDLTLLLLIVIWALRLGSYLFLRIHAMGRDKRFDAFRHKWLSFLGFWIVQAVSVWIILLPYIAGVDVPEKVVSPVFILGCALAFGGFLLEAVADYQKYVFKRSNPDGFMSTGVWKRIRHPNYTGEILFWTGLFVALLPFFSGWQYFTVVSPLWICFLLIRFSGIPLLRKKWDEKYGNDPAFQQYLQRSYSLFPYIY